MKKINQFVFQYLKWVSPVAAIAAVLSVIHKSATGWVIDFLGVMTILWILFLVYIVVAMVFQIDLRHQFVRKIAGLKESDEREVFITGQASKNTFILTSALVVLFLFLSVIRIEVSKNAQVDVNGKSTGVVNLGLALQFIDQKKTLSQATPEVDRSSNGKIYYINYQGFPLAADGTLILILLSQLGSFYYFSRKENKV